MFSQLMQVQAMCAVSQIFQFMQMYAIYINFCHFVSVTSADFGIHMGTDTDKVGQIQIQRVDFNLVRQAKIVGDEKVRFGFSLMATN